MARSARVDPGLADDLAQTAQSLATGYISFGNFVFGAGTNLNNTNAIAGTTNADSLGTNSESDSELEDSIDDAGSGSSGFLSDLKSIGLDFPLLDSPAAIVGLLLGKTVDLVTWQTADRVGEFFIWAGPRPILPPIPLFITIGGEVGFSFNLGVGFDTSGIQKGNFLDGLYFIDNPQKPLVDLYAKVDAGAELSIFVLSVGVDGYLKADVSANWNPDLVQNGKVYLDTAENTMRSKVCNACSICRAP